MDIYVLHMDYTWLNFYLQCMIETNHDWLVYIGLFLVYLALHKIIFHHVVS